LRTHYTILMTKPKKIAILCNYELLPERVGGMDRFFWLFDFECKKLGYELVWFFPNTTNHGDYKNLTIISANYQPLEFFFLSYCKQNKLCFDFVITHFLELCTSFFKEVKKQLSSKIIVVDHNSRPLGGYPFKKKIFKLIKGFLFSSYIDVFVAVSNYTKWHILNDFGNHLKSKTCLIYNGIDTSLYNVRINRCYNKPSFLVASNLGYPKGIQDLIDAVANLPMFIKNDIKIDVFGTGGYEQQLKTLVDKYYLNEIFTFKGSRSNLFEIYCQYDYLIQPSHMECFSLSILESLSANVPVITTSVGGNEEVVCNGENGFIFKSKDTIALKEIVENVYLGNMRIDANTRELIEKNFNLEKMVNNHIQLLL
jgi:glycosyltransferase involved in cell wall biosynthesis